MSGRNRTEAWERTLKAADQVKPMAQNTGDAARRTILRTRAWAAPQLERTGHALQDNVAPKVSAMLSTAAKRIDPAKPKRGQWRLPVGIAAALAAAASAAAAVIGGRQAGNGQANTSMPGDPAAPSDPSMAEGNGQVR
ncbi:MAG TPA: hypothetical protein VMA95_09875 [Streptosporangiaceae bacterium]|nr:hypothetical protein [Streptosporangiaceae bacterium]